MQSSPLPGHFPPLHSLRPFSYPFPPSSLSASAAAFHPFRFTQLETFAALVTSFSKASGGRGFYVGSVHPGSVHPHMLLFDGPVESLKGGLSILPGLVGGQLGPKTTFQLLFSGPPSFQSPLPMHSPQLSINASVSTQLQWCSTGQLGS